MIEQVSLSGFVIGFMSFLLFFSLMKSGFSYISAQNSTLLLMVLFENIMIGNCRSEDKSAFQINPFSNIFLLVGTIASQLLHIWAMHTGWLGNILGLKPVGSSLWFFLLSIALSVILFGELLKLYRHFFKNIA